MKNIIKKLKTHLYDENAVNIIFCAFSNFSKNNTLIIVYK